MVIKIDPRYFRPVEVDSLLGDATKAKEKLGWHSSRSLEKLVEEMIDHDLENARKEVLLNKNNLNKYH